MLALASLAGWASNRAAHGCGSCQECQSSPHSGSVAVSTAHDHMHSNQAELRTNRCTQDVPAQSSATGFRFGVVGDTQGLQYVEQLITDMNAHDPALVVFPGDLVGTGSLSSWDAWDQATDHFIGGANSRLMVPGNHDLPVGGDANWQQKFNWLPDSQTVGGVKGIDQMDYYVDLANTRFISITTDSQAHGAGGPPAAQRWLENVLNDPTTQAKDHVFVYSHHPVTFNEYDGTGGTAGPWWQAMGNAGNVTGLFVGHWHQYQPSQPHPHHHTWEVIAGTGNSGFSGHPWQNEVGYSIVEVEGPRARLKFYGDSDGDGSYDDLLDSFTMADVRPGPAGVVAYYGFEDTAENRDGAISELAKRNSGEYFEDASVVANGVIGKALSLDGNGDYANGRGIGDYNMAILGDLTVALQANFDQLGNGPNDNTLISYTANVAGYTDYEEAVNQPYNLRIRADKRLEMFWERNNNIKEVFVSTTAANVTAGEWHEYRVTRDATTGELTFYVDGAQLGDALVFDPLSQLPTGGAQGTLRIGINYNRDHPQKLVGGFDGRLDELAIWNQVTLDTYTGPPIGDLNLDGVLNEEDIPIFIDRWKTASLNDNVIVRWTKGDLDFNGQSDLYDLVMFQRALQDVGLEFPGLPEPSGFSLAVLGMMVMFFRRSP